jgi:hypothetical protein
MKIVQVTWTDPAFSDDGWLHSEAFARWIKKGMSINETWGLLAYESNDLIVILQSWSEGDGTYAGALKITRSAIQRIQVLVEVDIKLDLEVK